MSNTIKLYREFRTLVRRQLRSRTGNTTEIDKKVHREFVNWFFNRVSMFLACAKSFYLVGNIDKSNVTFFLF